MAEFNTLTLELAASAADNGGVLQQLSIICATG